MVNFPDISNTNYFTNRSLPNKEGEMTGKILMFREKGKEEYHLIMTCPFCGHEQERDEAFEKKPFRPKCSSCTKSILISKLKDAGKSKKKKKE
ncbi:MAG: hypothetical protein K0B02_04445 [DPANN group archaeon]|nr:hypothetical protein [DPANN group archaeon]